MSVEMKTILLFGLVCCLLVSCTEKKSMQSKANVSTIINSDIEILDTNGDGIVNPYEALDALLVLQKINGKNISLKNFSNIVSKQKTEKEEEFSEMFKEFDANKDGVIELTEVNGDMSEFAQAMDTNEDNIISVAEMLEFDFEDVFLASEEDIKIRINETFEELDTNKDKIIDILNEVKKERQGRITEWDFNRDQKATKEEAFRFLMADNVPVKFNIKENTAYMTGVITKELPTTVLELLFKHPNVTTIEMLIVPGSIDDEANIRAALYVNQFGLTTKLNSKSIIASGGTDFFLAGKQRIVEDGAVLGVHSWGGGPVPATEVPKDDPIHKKYIDFYNIVGIPEAFYWYTLEVAPASNMHIMTEDEIKGYKIRTKN